MSEEKPAIELGWPEIATIILASQGITSGLWRLGVKIRFAAMSMQFPEENKGVTNVLALPTTLAAIEAIALFPAQTPGSMIFDAAELSSQAKLRTGPAAKSKPVTVKAVKPSNRIAKTLTAPSKAKARPTKVKA